VARPLRGIRAAFRVRLISASSIPQLLLSLGHRSIRKST
jgi:hypothetical protein